MYDFLAETRNYRIFFWLSLPVHSGSLKGIDYPKQICLAHPLSFECFHCSLRNSSLYFYLCKKGYVFYKFANIRYEKTCAEEISYGLSAIFQYSLATGTLPLDWRNANVTPVFKKGDRHLAENYRPVSLTTVSCKIMEHIICSHMLKHFLHI